MYYTCNYKQLISIYALKTNAQYRFLNFLFCKILIIMCYLTFNCVQNYKLILDILFDFAKNKEV